MTPFLASLPEQDRNLILRAIGAGVSYDKAVAAYLEGKQAESNAELEAATQKAIEAHNARVKK